MKRDFYGFRTEQKCLLVFYQHMKGVLVVEEKTEADLNHLKMFNVEIKKF